MAIEPVALLKCLKEDLSSQGLPTESCEFWPDITTREAAAVSLVSAFLKKLKVSQTRETDDAALAKFIACNDACGTWSLDVSIIDTKTEIILNTIRQCLDNFWHPGGLDLVDHDYDVLERGALGPGLTVQCRGNDFYTKLFSGPLTVSNPSLYFWYRRYIRAVPEWSIADQIRSLDYGDNVITESSRLSFVPKNDEISRCICIEPTLNGFYQLGFGRILEGRLHGVFGISLKSQPFKNRALARLGSITDGLATLDLSSASDSISLKMLQYLLPRNFYRFLCRYRTSQVDVKGRGTVVLNMVSTMGNGYTFPLQTVLFAAVVTACLKFRGIPVKSTRASELWSVFGDDIICPSVCTEDVVNILVLLGFKVNRDKSFVKGPFRESCGSDFFRGSDIRGVYVKTLKTPEARYSVINLLTRFSTKTGIDLSRTIRTLINSVDKLLVPPWEDYSSGIHVPHSVSNRSFRDKWTQSQFYWARVPRARKIRFKGGYVVVPRGCKSRIYNPPGLLVSLLQGSVKSESIGVREPDSIRYQTKRRIAPSWDQFVVSTFESQDYGMDWGQWSTVLEEIFERS